MIVRMPNQILKPLHLKGGGRIKLRRITCLTDTTEKFFTLILRLAG
jgi:hypothetical protein